MLPSIARVVASNIVRYVRHGGLDAPGLKRASLTGSIATSPLAPATDHRAEAFAASKRGILLASKTSSIARLRSKATVSPSASPRAAQPAAPNPHPLHVRKSDEIGWASTRQERAKRDFVARFARVVGYSYSELVRLNRVK